MVLRVGKESADADMTDSSANDIATPRRHPPATVVPVQRAIAYLPTPAPSPLQATNTTQNISIKLHVHKETQRDVTQLLTSTSMASTSTILRAARPMFRQGAFAAQARQAFTRTTQQQHAQQTLRLRFQQSRRWQSSGAGAGAAGEGAGSQQQQQQQQASWFKRMWESEVGIKTVHFWAPVMKVR